MQPLEPLDAHVYIQYSYSARSFHNKSSITCSDRIHFIYIMHEFNDYILIKKYIKPEAA
jgi:hypothetical protein